MTEPLPLAFIVSLLDSQDSRGAWISLRAGVLATFLFLCSSSFHLFQGMGVGASQVLVKLDYIGILVQICGSFVSALHYSFYCCELLLCRFVCIACYSRFIQIDEDIKFFYQLGIVTFCLLA